MFGGYALVPLVKCSFGVLLDLCFVEGDLCWLTQVKVEIERSVTRVLLINHALDDN